ncbi:family 20 glycosylhydrolase [Antribacter gilvus]|uniref:family 20 glycosylhydrolase n=1 Tax=Antribacter gilvus TaxID=2304675 RepID=UPI000F7791BB|nr:family 20 glycosylhydrolase [Antribacter gilvus]
MTSTDRSDAPLHAVIPAPLVVERADGAPVPLGAVVVAAPDERLRALAAELLESAGSTVLSDGDGTAVTLTLDPAAGPSGSDHPERYSLVVRDGAVAVTAAEAAGLLHGVRTLRQLVSAATVDPATGDVTSGAPEVAAVVVHDAPRFAWRGLSVDVVRHWFGPEDLRAVVDLAASYKMNRLHLHLTDDQGWRLEIPSRPELVKVSGQTQVGGGPAGYLTVAEFRALQEYAAERFVVVVPEVDVPGHVNAATHVYGELTPDGQATDVYEGIEVGFSRLHLDLPATEPFLRDVFTDVAAQTLGPWVHFGGDEVLTMAPDEYAGFVSLCQEIITEAGKTPVAWQEAAGVAHGDQAAAEAAQAGAAAGAAAAGAVEAGGLPVAAVAQAVLRDVEEAHLAAPLVKAGTVLQLWDTRPDPAPFLRAAEAGARFVLSPATRCYLDMKYTPEHPLGLQWAGFVELRDAYDWDPGRLITGLPESAVEGVSAAVWTETLVNRDDLFSMLLPRLAAVAEAAWSTQEAKDWESFRERVVTEAAAWRRDGAAFHPTPQVDW